MTLGKNFRLPTEVKPKSYDADLRVDLAAGRFEGTLVIALQLAAPRNDIPLHAVGLDVTVAGVDLPGGRHLPATAALDATSETVMLAFGEALPACPCRMDAPGWTGARRRTFSRAARAPIPRPTTAVHRAAQEWVIVSGVAPPTTTSVPKEDR